MGAELLPMVFTSGWASGINAYAVVLVMGLIGRFTGLGAIPDVLTRTDVLIGAALLFLAEMVADKIPGVDSVWDAVHTVIRPAVGATLGYLLAHDASSLDAAFAATSGGFSALASHSVKAALRGAINTSPEPVSNVAVSSAEDLTVAGVISLATVNPWLAAGIAAVLLVLGIILVVFLLRRLRRLHRRYEDWDIRRGIAQPRRGSPGGPPGRRRRGTVSRTADRGQDVRLP